MKRRSVFSDGAATADAPRAEGMKKLLKIIRGDTEAASAVEYGVLIALISAVIILAVQRLGATMSTTFSNVNSLVAAATGGGDGGDDDGGSGGTCCD